LIEEHNPNAHIDENNPNPRHKFIKATTTVTGYAVMDKDDDLVKLKEGQKVNLGGGVTLTNMGLGEDS